MAQRDWLHLGSNETHVGSPAPQCVKDLALPQLWCRSQLHLGTDPWPGNTICHGAAQKEREKEDEEAI